VGGASSWGSNSTVSDTAEEAAADEEGWKWDVTAFAPSPLPGFRFLLAAGWNYIVRAAVADATGLLSPPLIYPVAVPKPPTDAVNAKVSLDILRQSVRLGDLTTVAQLTVATVLSAALEAEENITEPCEPSNIAGSALSEMALAIASQLTMSPSRHLEAATAAAAAATALPLPATTVEGAPCMCTGSAERGLHKALVTLAFSTIALASDSIWSMVSPTSGAAAEVEAEAAHRGFQAVGSLINSIAMLHVSSSALLTDMQICESDNTTGYNSTSSPNASNAPNAPNQLFAEFLSTLGMAVDAKFTTAIEASPVGSRYITWWQDGALTAIGPGAVDVGSGAWGLCARILPPVTCDGSCPPPLEVGNVSFDGACRGGRWTALDQVAAAVAAAVAEGGISVMEGAMPGGTLSSDSTDQSWATSHLTEDGASDEGSVAPTSAGYLVAWTHQSLTIPSAVAVAENLVSKVAMRGVILVRNTSEDVTYSTGVCTDGGQAVWRRTALAETAEGNFSGMLVPVESSDGKLALGLKEGAQCVMWEYGNWTRCSGGNTNSEGDGCGNSTGGGGGGTACGAPPRFNCASGECVAECVCPKALWQGLFVAVRFDPCAAVCGNARLDSGEQCDDGEIVSGDGCDSVCMIEPGFACEQPAATASHSAEEGGGEGETLRQCSGEDGASLCVLAALDVLVVVDSTDLPSVPNRISVVFAVRCALRPASFLTACLMSYAQTASGSIT
jgi:cysteine-rich repeat protein